MPEFPVSTVYLLKRAELAVRGCIEVALGEVELTPSQFFVLLLVESEEATSSAELARAMGVLPQSMTELIAPLEKRGVIVRRPDPDNNRILRIRLSAAGRRLFAKAAEVAARLEQELVRGIEPQELARLNRGLDDLCTRAEAHDTHPKIRRLTGAMSAATPRGKRGVAGRRAASGS